MPIADAAIIRAPSRLAALRATGLLDAPPQEALDRLTRLATTLLGVPIAVVSLVDENQQRFASAVGVGEPWATARGTPLSHSFCQHVVATRAPLIVDDATAHPLVSDNLAVPELGVIAYAGMPLISADGEILGSFCAIDTSPKHWTAPQLAILEDLAHAATAEIQLRSAMRLLANRQAFLGDMLDHTGDLVCATNETGRISYANAAMIETTGYALEEIIRCRPADLVAEVCRPAFIDAGRRVRNGETIRDLETIVVTKEGQRLIVRGSAMPIEGDNGVIVGARIIFRDLTKERAAQKLKDELIALVSHELRAPVGAIRSALTIIEPHVTHLDGRPRQLFQMAQRNSDRLLTLVNDLLDVERLEAGRDALQITNVDVGAVLEYACDVMQTLAYGAGVHIAVTPATLFVTGDAGRLEQVLVNLVGNAIKFSPRDSVVTLSAEVVDGYVRFCVADQGRGIPADKADRIFERFEQVTKTDATEKGGAGLGLAISKAIVAQHGGRIWVDSVPGEGSQFYFTVPLPE